MIIHGYIEEGTTTSPFDVNVLSLSIISSFPHVRLSYLFLQMMLCNHTSRYDVARDAVRMGAVLNAKVAVSSHMMESYLKHLAQKAQDYIYTHGQGI